MHVKRLKPIRGDEIGQRVTAREGFINTTGKLRGGWVRFWDPDNDVYVVKSYDRPIYIYIAASDKWLTCVDSISLTTARHRTVARPQVPASQIERRDMVTMIEIEGLGLLGAIRNRLARAV